MSEDKIISLRRLSEDNIKKEEDVKFMKMSPKAQESMKIQKESETLKIKGNEEQKNKNLDTAIKFFEEALTLTPHDINLKLNLASAFLEKNEYEKCLTQCEIVLKNSNDSIKRSRAFGKMGIAFLAMNNIEKAIDYFKKSLSEHKDEQIEIELNYALIMKNKIDEQLYLNPEIAENHNKKANELYLSGRYDESLNEFSQAIKRNPFNYKYYCDRGEAFIKVLALNEAIKDFDKSIELDQNFIRAYIRKGKCHIMKKEFPSAIEIYELGLNIQPDNKEMIGGKKMCLDSLSLEFTEMCNEKIKNADQETKKLLNDQRIKKLLENFKENPNAAYEAMKKDKYLSDSFRKLIGVQDFAM